MIDMNAKYAQNMFLKGRMVMKVAVVGSRDIIVQDLELFLPKGITEIVSGGARGKRVKRES